MTYINSLTVTQTNQHERKPICINHGLQCRLRCHLTNVTRASCRPKSLTDELFVHQFVQAKINKHKSATWLILCEDNAPWDSPTKGPSSGMGFHVMMSSWITVMMTSSNVNISRVTGPLWGESIGHRWIPLTKASDTERWCFLWSAAKTNGWAITRDAGDLRRHRAYYDVTVM